MGNEAAKKSYRKLGFNEVHEIVDSEFEAQYGVPGVVHMSLRSLASVTRIGWLF